MSYAERKELYEKIEADRNSSVILHATGDRPGMESQISHGAFDYFVHHLDKIWPKNSKKITLILHTGGGDTAAAWRLINLLRIFCDDLEVIVPNRAHSAGTLISLGANRIVMTKQATLGPIDPSLTGPLSPSVPENPQQRVPVSVEAVQGYLDLARDELSIKDPGGLSQILVHLTSKVHPLVLGQIFRSRNQIRSLAETLLDNHDGLKKENKDRIVDFLCSDSGSHDRTINRREARALGLNIENPSQDLYNLVNNVYEDLAQEMVFRRRFDPMVELQGRPTVQFSCPRALVESVDGGSTQLQRRGTIKLLATHHNPGPGMPQVVVSGTEVAITFDGWEQL